MRNVVGTKRDPSEVALHYHSGLSSYPEKWDWREKGFVTGVSYNTYSSWIFPKRKEGREREKEKGREGGKEEWVGGRVFGKEEREEKGSKV